MESSSVPARAAESLTLVHSASPWRDRQPTWALYSPEGIVASGTGSEWRLAADKASQITDATGRVLAPGLVDNHCHGGAGRAFEDAGEAGAILEEHGRHGTRVMTASLVSNSAQTLKRSIAGIVEAMGSGLPIAGIHLEGPCLSLSHKGAHAPEHLVRPSVQTLEPLLEAADGAIRQVTLAPELDDGFAATRFLVENGVRVAVGHTDADYGTARAAFDAGASILTHTFNAMRGLHHRAPGPIAAAIDSPHVTLELIADGVHVHAPLVRLAFAAAPGRIALITDAMAATGCGDGAYRLGDLDVVVSDSVARLADGSSIAGSTLTMDRAVAFAVASGIPVPDAVAAATECPAKALGLTSLPRFAEAGTLKPGAPAPALLSLPRS